MKDLQIFDKWRACIIIGGKKRIRVFEFSGDVEAAYRYTIRTWGAANFKSVEVAK